MAAAQKTSKTYQLSLARRVGYGIGDFGINMFSTVVGSFLTAYYTDSVLLGAIFVGNMMLFTRILDGVSDLIMGAIIDHTYTKWGKARPWLALSINGGGQVYYCFFSGDTARDEGLITPEDVLRMDDLSYGDINLLFTWIMAHGAEYHTDTHNLCIVSDSSGAQIASQYCALLTNPGFQPCFPFTPPEGLHIRAVALNCGIYDAKGYILSDRGAPIHYYARHRRDQRRGCGGADPCMWVWTPWKWGAAVSAAW